MVSGFFSGFFFSVFTTQKKSRSFYVAKIEKTIQKKFQKSRKKSLEIEKKISGFFFFRIILDGYLIYLDIFGYIYLYLLHGHLTKNVVVVKMPLKRLVLSILILAFIHFHLTNASHKVKKPQSSDKNSHYPWLETPLVFLVLTTSTFLNFSGHTKLI